MDSLATSCKYNSTINIIMQTYVFLWVWLLRLEKYTLCKPLKKKIFKSYLQNLFQMKQNKVA